MSWYEVTVDIDDALAHCTEGERTLHETAQGIWDIADEAGRREQSSKRYQNRTGDTQASSIALPPMVVGSDAVEVELAMRTEYSSHLVRRGFSDFEEIAEECSTDIDNFLNAEVDRVSRL